MAGYQVFLQHTELLAEVVFVHAEGALEETREVRQQSAFAAALSEGGEPHEVDDEQRARFATDPDRADAVAGVGNRPAAEYAAWTAAARAILNLDEFVTKE